jgi:chaperonin GroEL
MRQIVANAGGEPSVVVNKVLQGEAGYGYNARTQEYGDLVAQGVIDPTKVVRTAIQHAASVAGMMLTTEAMIAEVPKKEAPSAGGGGGGMGGMDM